MWWEQHWTELVAICTLAFNAGLMFAAKRELAKLSDHVAKQNGRVGKLERWRAWHEGRDGVTFDDEEARA